VEEQLRGPTGADDTPTSKFVNERVPNPSVFKHIEPHQGG